ncbi:MAG: hypothetical protein OXI56_12630 [bacterium]|nr:hypothetical protein [bacterium]MDE0602633.1 hypothetical protein [bacterium]
MLRAWRWWLLLIVAVGVLVGWETGFFDSRIVDLEWEGEPVEFRVLAFDHQGRFAVVDLEEGVMRVERLEHRGLPIRSVNVAAFTRSGDVLVHPSGGQGLYVVPDGDFSAAPSVIGPSRRVIETEYGTPDNYADIQALADRSGEKVWMLQWTNSDTTLVDLVNIEDNTAELTLELDGSYFISGLFKDELYVVTGDDDRVVSPGGTVSEVVPCRDFSDEYGDLHIVGVYGEHFACLTLEDEKHLVFHSETDGRVSVVTAFESGRWSRPFLPQIPASNTTEYHSDQVLLSLEVPDVTRPGYTVRKAVYLADLSEQTVQLVHEFEEGRRGTPLGIVDGLLIASTGVIGEESIVVIDIETGEWNTVVDLPEGYFIYDAK